ncbi:uncharacterized protein PHALS_03347 [Plasmopara halstedii]|uniref:Uncharacterized protein n=1 Tax=Plasmopara halstedii TaxID=4781 RepID=A0A0P1A8P9_PLAHL|nr:uncharacterized protein PHALS_03347 [Plasmopara halstedii]CEG36679.1 hypothetical protein PHALS_03347 [Plasmopara halstedii]|eukprot:XP_024573048.1 hypothetical protein PHALS_03347 [Plasmopara halstedii]
MWSQRPIFAGSNTYLSSEMDETAVASAIQSAVTRELNEDKEGVLSSQTFLPEQSELMCLYLLPSLASEQISQLTKKRSSFIQSAIQSSMSSVVIPHTTRTKPLLPGMANAKPHIVGIDDLKIFMTSAEGKSIFSNGKTDLLVVQIPSSMPLLDVDAAIQSASISLNEITGDRTDFAFTGNDATSVGNIDFFSRHLAAPALSEHNNSSSETTLLCESGYLVGHSATGKAFCFSHYVNITPDIMTPQRYPQHGAPRGKEF